VSDAVRDVLTEEGTIGLLLVGVPDISAATQTVNIEPLEQ
jgi:hypothetical protein